MGAASGSYTETTLWHAAKKCGADDLSTAAPIEPSTADELHLMANVIAAAKRAKLSGIAMYQHAAFEFNKAILHNLVVSGSAAGVEGMNVRGPTTAQHLKRKSEALSAQKRQTANEAELDEEAALTTAEREARELEAKKTLRRLSWPP